MGLEHQVRRWQWVEGFMREVHSPGSQFTKDDLELLNLLPPCLPCQHERHAVSCSIYGVYGSGHQIQGFIHAGQAPYQLSHTFNQDGKVTWHLSSPTLTKMAASRMATSVLFLQLLPFFTELSKAEGRGNYKTEQFFFFFSKLSWRKVSHSWDNHKWAESLWQTFLPCL